MLLAEKFITGHSSYHYKNPQVVDLKRVDVIRKQMKEVRYHDLVKGKNVLDS